MTNKIITNEQAIKRFIKSMHTVEVALLRERLVTISKLTRQALEQDATQFEGIMWTPQMFTDLCNKIDEHLGFE